MISLQNLTPKEKVYLTELANQVINPPISVEVLHSLKPNVLQVVLNSLNIRPLKKKVLQNIINKIPRPVLLDGEFYNESTQLELFYNL